MAKTQCRKGLTVKTFTPKPVDLTHDWYVIDAQQVVLGRLAVAVSTLLRGKTKRTFAPNADSGDYVVIVNAGKVALTGKKDAKISYRHSGYPGGLREDTFGSLRKNDPDRLIRQAVWGMLPKNKLSRRQIKRLRVVAGEKNPYAAQKPKNFAISQIPQCK